MLAPLLLAFAPQVPSAYLEHYAAGAEALDLGELERAEEELTAARALAPESPLPAYALACAAARRGERERAFALLDEAIALGFDDPALAAWDSDLQPLREDPRWKPIVSTIPPGEEPDSAEIELVCCWPSKPEGVTLAEERIAEGKPLPAEYLWAREAPGRAPRMAAISPKGEVVLPVEGGSLRRVDTTTARPLPTIELDSTNLRVLFDPAGERLLAAQSVGGLLLLDVAKSAVVSTIPTKPADTSWRWRELAFDLHGQFVAFPEDGTIDVWRLEPPELACRIASEEGTLDHFAWCPDGERIVVGGSAGTVLLWSVTESREVARRQRRCGITSLAVSPDGETVAIGESAAIVVLWRPATDTIVHELVEREMPVYWDDRIGSLCFSRDGRTLLATTNPWWAVSCWDLEGGGRRWYHDGAGGNPAPIEAWFDAEERLVFTNAWTSWVLDAEDGELLRERFDVGGFLVGSAGERFFWLDDGLKVFDCRSLDMLYRWVPLADDGWAAQAGSGHLAGTLDGFVRCALRARGANWAADTFASTLFDPKRVRAAAAGVDLAPARVPVPPRIVAARPDERAVDRGEAPLVLELSARAERGALRFEVDIAGIRLAPQRVEAGTEHSTRAPEATLRLVLSSSELSDGADIRVRAFDRRGTASAPHLVRIVRAGRER